MIKYQLHCDKGHDFEAWFSSSDAFEKQKKRGLVECAHCGSIKVDRAIMAPNVARTDNHSKNLPQGWVTESAPALMTQEEKELRQKLAELRAELTKDADDVGEKFAEEARKMHFGEAETRRIYGRATLDDARDLIDEGIGVLPLPPSLDEGN